MRGIWLLFILPLTVLASDDFAGFPILADTGAPADTDAAKLLPDSLTNFFHCRGQLKCEFLARHLRRDSVSCMPDPATILTRAPYTRLLTQKTVVGRIRYMDFFAKKYHYTFFTDADGVLTIRSTIAISNRDDFTGLELYTLQEKLNYAGSTWSHWFRASMWNYVVQTGTHVRFEFRIAEPNEAAFFRIRLTRRWTRGPYDSTWSLDWPSFVFTHEMGHVMGLDDEYKNGFGEGDDSHCIKGSLMCNEMTGIPLDIHYYLILRRMACNYPKDRNSTFVPGRRYSQAELQAAGLSAEEWPYGI